MVSLKIAVPNKGRLAEDSIRLINKAGINIINYKDRVLYSSTKDGNYTVVFLRTQDIPSFVSQGVVDIGITGEDIVYESQENVEIIKKLDFGYCKMIVAASQDSNINSIDDIPDGAKVATSFVNIADKYFKEHNKNVRIIEISGATEVSPHLGLADIIVDITSTGSTLKVNKLKIIAEILDSTTVVVANKEVLKESKDEIDMFCLAIDSVLVAQNKKYLLANVPKVSLDEIKRFLPGLSAPTVIKLLDKEDQLAIHVVVDNDKVYESIRKLKQLGGSGILIMSVDQMIK
ncbi:MAG: ATP phosphoribosyltransferase [Cyanobacteriota bacterium]